MESGSLSFLPPAATSVDKGECLGGATLSLLHDRTVNYTGDSQAQELCLYLTKAASVPYFEVLEKWIYRGIIHDPYRLGPSCGGSLLGGLVALDSSPHALCLALSPGIRCSWLSVGG